MDGFWISGRKALDDASALMDAHGGEATDVAARRARESRSKDNIVRYCHWRQIERVITVLESPDRRGMIH